MLRPLQIASNSRARIDFALPACSGSACDGGVLMRSTLMLILFAALTTHAAPKADYHVHLLSPVTAKMAEEPPLPAVSLPAELAPLFRERERAWNDPDALAALYAEDAVAFNQYGGDSPTWLRGRENVAEFVAILFARTYRITPVAVTIDGGHAQLAGYFTRGEGEAMKRIGHVFLSLRKASDGAWRIAAETPSFPGPPVREPMTAEQLIEQLDDAGIRHGVVLSVAYWFGSRSTPPSPAEQDKVRAENDWVAAQVARYPERLVAFCGVNPLRDYALDEIARCASIAGVKGIKLHFGNSGIDLRKAGHVEQLRRVFALANDRRLAIVAHLWTGPEYEQHGGEDARLFLEQLLPLATDIPVQIAHMAGGGRSTTAALAVFADAIAAGDARTKRLYFDVATLTAGQNAEGLRSDAAMMRRIGFDRILYGTDTAPPNPVARQSWTTFRIQMPLSDDELRIIEGNALPYLPRGTSSATSSRSGGD